MDHGQVLADDTLAGLYRRLPVVQTLALTLSGAAASVDLAALARDTGLGGASGPGEGSAANLTQQGPQLHIGLASDTALAPAAAAVLAWLAGHGHTVGHLASSQARLEDVFLALTGRQLRD